MSFANKTLTCRDCGQEFVFTAGEQEFYAQKGFTNEPTRCPTCRQANKAASGRGGSSRRDSYGDGGYGGERQMHTTTCASCGKEAQVPFVPRGERPVYCSACYSKIKPPTPREAPSF